MDEKIKIAIEADIEHLKDSLNNLEESLNQGYTNEKLRAEDIGYCQGILHAIKYIIDSRLYVELDDRLQEVKKLYRKVIYNYNED